MSDLAAPRECPFCNIPPRNSLALRADVRLLECPQCSLRWWPFPPFDPGAFYDRDYFQSAAAKGYNDYAAMEPGIRRTASARLHRIRRLAAHPGGTLLEIGCGTGVFLDQARGAGWQVKGLEVSAYAAEQARRRGLDVSCTSIDEFATNGAAFDCVVLWDVIEHLRAPRSALSLAAGLLKPGGILALSTGDVTSWCARLSGRRWHLYNLPEHLFFFSPAAMQRGLAQAGCRVERITNEVNWVPVRYACERLGKTLLGRDPRISARWGDWLLPATLFDVMGVYSIKAPGAGR